MVVIHDRTSVMTTCVNTCVSNHEMVRAVRASACFHHVTSRNPPCRRDGRCMIQGTWYKVQACRRTNVMTGTLMAHGSRISGSLKNRDASSTASRDDCMPVVRQMQRDSATSAVPRATPALVMPYPMQNAAAWKSSTGSKTAGPPGLRRWAMLREMGAPTQQQVTRTLAAAK